MSTSRFYDRSKPWLFCLLLIAFWLPAASIIVSVTNLFGLGSKTLGENVAIAIVETAPIIADDISLFGEATPFFVAGLLTILAPKKEQKGLIITAVILCAIGWLVYLWFSVFLGRPAVQTELANILVDSALKVQTERKAIPYLA